MTTSATLPAAPEGEGESAGPTVRRERGLAQAAPAPPGIGDLVAVARRTALFAEVAPETVARLVAGAEVLEIAHGGVLFSRGETAERFFIVARGQVELYLRSHDGREAVVEIARAGDSFGESALFGPGRFPFSARALRQAEVLAIPARPFLDALSRDPGLLGATTATLARRERILLRLIGELQLRSTAQRLGSFLLDLVPAAATRGAVQLPWNKRVLARRLGMKPESLSRAQARLRELGVAIQNVRVTISDVKRLRDFCHDEDFSERL